MKLVIMLLLVILLAGCARGHWAYPGPASEASRLAYDCQYMANMQAKGSGAFTGLVANQEFESCLRSRGFVWVEEQKPNNSSENDISLDTNTKKVSQKDAQKTYKEICGGKIGVFNITKVVESSVKGKEVLAKLSPYRKSRSFDAKRSEFLQPVLNNLRDVVRKYAETNDFALIFETEELYDLKKGTKEPSERLPYCSDKGEVLLASLNPIDVSSDILKYFNK